MVQESKALFICCPTRGFQFLNEFHRYDIIARMETFFEDSEYIIERWLYYLYLHIDIRIKISLEVESISQGWPLRCITRPLEQQKK